MLRLTAVAHAALIGTDDLLAEPSLILAVAVTLGLRPGGSVDKALTLGHEHRCPVPVY